MKVLITGGCGFIGSYVVQELLRAPGRPAVSGSPGAPEIVVYDLALDRNVLDAVVPADQRSRLRLIRGSLLDSWSLVAALRDHGVEAVVHLASPLSDDVQTNPAMGVREIAMGSVNLFEACRVAGIRRVVWASTQLVFGQIEDPSLRVANDAPQAPDTLYGANKALVERLAGWYRDAGDLDPVGLRFTMVYGPGRLRGRGTFLTQYLHDALVEHRVSIPFADQYYNWQYVKDAARATRCALEAGSRREHHVYNVAGDFRSASDFAEILTRACPGTRCEVTPGHNPTYRHTVMNIDGSVTACELGFSPAYDLESGVRDALDEYRKKGQ